MELKINVVDAFSDEVFKGNPAAVIKIEQWLDLRVMQSIAMENNLSETAFVKPIDDNHFEIRWFSPICEVDFCGHATLASAFVIFSQNALLKEINFYAHAVGSFVVTQKENNIIEMNFPSREPTVVKNIPEALIRGLSIKPIEVLKNDQAYFAIYACENDVLSVNYDVNNFKKLAPLDVVVSAKSVKYDFVSRYFWPANGGDEDPVTGSIHAGLAPYWSTKLLKKELVAWQASQRGGLIFCEVVDDRVNISGKAVQYLSGSIVI